MKKIVIFFSVVIFLSYCYIFVPSFNITDDRSKAAETVTINDVMLADLMYCQGYGKWPAMAKLTYYWLPPEDIKATKLSTLKNDYCSNVVYSEDKFYSYTSNLTIFMHFYRMFDRIVPLSNADTIRGLNVINCLATAVTAGIFFMFMGRRFGYTAMWFTLILCGMFMYDFNYMVKTLYWVPYSLFLPMSAMILFLSKKDKFIDERKFNMALFCVAFVSCLFKQLCYNEMVSSVMVAMCIPLFFYFTDCGKSLRQVLSSFIYVFIGAILSFVAANIIRFFVILSEYKDVSETIDIIISKINLRLVSGVSGKKDYIGTLLMMLQDDCISVSGKISISYGQIILAFLAFSIFAVIVSTGFLKFYNKNLYGDLSVVWLSILSPMSWFILAQPHTLAHPDLMTILWYLPFIPLCLCMSVGLLIKFVIYLVKECFGKLIKRVGA